MPFGYFDPRYEQMFKQSSNLSKFDSYESQYAKSMQNMSGHPNQPMMNYGMMTMANIPNFDPKQNGKVSDNQKQEESTTSDAQNKEKNYFNPNFFPYYPYPPMYRNEVKSTREDEPSKFKLDLLCQRTSFSSLILYRGPVQRWAF